MGLNATCVLKLQLFLKQWRNSSSRVVLQKELRCAIVDVWVIGTLCHVSSLHCKRMQYLVSHHWSLGLKRVRCLPPGKYESSCPLASCIRHARCMLLQGVPRALAMPVRPALDMRAAKSLLLTSMSRAPAGTQSSLQMLFMSESIHNISNKGLQTVRSFWIH